MPFFVIVTTEAAKNCSLKVKQKADIDMKRGHNVLHLSKVCFFNGYRFFLGTISFYSVSCMYQVMLNPSLQN